MAKTGYGVGDGEGAIVGVAVGLGVGVGVGLGAGVVESKSSSSKDVEPVVADEVDDSSDVPPDNVVVVDVVELFVADAVAEPDGVGIGCKCFR